MYSQRSQIHHQDLVQQRYGREVEGVQAFHGRESGGADPPLHHALVPVDELQLRDVLAVLTPRWVSKKETASRVWQRMGKIFDWSIVHGHRERANPATKAILVGLPKVKQVKEHHRALPYSEVPEALRKVGLSTAYPAVKLAFRFLVLAAARSGEVRGADWGI